MSAFLHPLLFEVYPYLCLAIFVVGCVLRMRRNPYSWQASSSQLLSKRGFVLASNAFHLGMLALFGGHVMGLAVPAQLNHMVGMTDAQHQQVEILMGSIFGTTTLVGLAFLIRRRLQQPRVRSAGSRMDLAIVVLLAVVLVLGMSTLPWSFQTRMDGRYLVALNQWSQALLTLQPGASQYLLQLPWVFKLHIVAGLSVFLIFPFTRLVHVCSVPVTYLIHSHRQIVRAARSYGS